MVLLIAAAACASCAGSSQAPPTAPAATPPVALQLHPRPSSVAEPLHVDVRGKLVTVRGEPAPSDALALRGALARQRHGATTLEAQLIEVDDATLDGLLEASMGTELRRVVLLSAGSRYEVSLVPSHEPTHEVSPGPDGRLHLHALSGGSDSAALSWSPGDDGVTPELRAKLDALCASGCRIQVSRAARVRSSRKRDLGSARCRQSRTALGVPAFIATFSVN